MRTLLCATTVLFLLVACSRPKPPEKERPVEPQATQLRDAIQAPIEKAQQVEDQVKAAADAQRAAIEAAEGAGDTH